MNKPTTPQTAARFSSRKGIGGTGPTYVCKGCGKRTRETGLEESSVESCRACYIEDVAENLRADGRENEAAAWLASRAR